MSNTPGNAGEPPVPTVEVGQLMPRLDRGEPVLLLDVRNEEEYETWKVEPRRPVQTVHVPYFDFIEDAEGSIAKVPRDREVVVLCAQGGSSEMVVGMLAEAGIKSRNIKGGMIAYGVYLEPVRVPLAREDAGRFELWQVNRRGKACLSYVVVAGGEAVVVDPSRHIEWYEGFAQARGARITRVLDTHVHADHVSGGPALARKHGVPYFVAAGDGFELKQPVSPLGDGERVRIGGTKGVDLEVRVLSTPGHTPGSTSFLVGGKHLLTGDTLFVSSVGRPDLGGHVVEWGEALYDTLTRRLTDVPAETVILPAHYGGIAEIGAEGVVSGRLGELRSTVPEMQIASSRDFVELVKGAVKEPPPAYAEIIKVNLGAEASPEKLSEWELGKNQCAASAGKATRA
jgi:glyoxylase-like metal-dependent hydrolase (beta-lactamase superfamily II)/rhodanese-related sulfurtransferase